MINESNNIRVFHFVMENGPNECFILMEWALINFSFNMQSNLNNSNTFGTLETCSRYG